MDFHESFTIRRKNENFTSEIISGSGALNISSMLISIEVASFKFVLLSSLKFFLSSISSDFFGSATLEAAEVRSG